MLKYLRQSFTTNDLGGKLGTSRKRLQHSARVPAHLNHNSFSENVDKNSRQGSFWPNGARAAVSFTYDDGRESQLDIAVEDLDHFGFKGTFFITPDHFNVRERLNDWKKAHSNGHEIHNHTISHSRNYDIPQKFVDEQIIPCEKWLNIEFIRQDTKAFAYPEGMPNLMNGARYEDAIRNIFASARVADGALSSVSEAQRNPHLISSRASTWGNDGSEQSIRFIDSAARIDRGWAVLCFHDIVEGKKTNDADTSRQAHRDIMAYLMNNQEKFWVAPYVKVFDYINSST